MSPKAKKPPLKADRRTSERDEPRRDGQLARPRRPISGSELDLDGSGQYAISTGISFFDHMLESFARHGLFDLEVEGDGRRRGRPPPHRRGRRASRSARPFARRWAAAVGIRRFGACLLPMAESKVEVAVDVSNRPYLVYRARARQRSDRRSFDASLTEDFMYAFSQSAGLDLHIEKRYGQEPASLRRGGVQGRRPGAARCSGDRSVERAAFRR